MTPILSDDGHPPRTRITALATLPPPVTGQTLANQCIVNALSEYGAVRLFNWSDGRHVRGWQWKVVKGVRSVISAVRLFGWLPRPGEWLYTAVNTGWGLCWNLMIAGTARLLGYRVILHHNSYSYLHRYDRRMSWLHRIVGRDSLHLVLGPEMGDRLHQVYGRRVPYVIVPNTIIMEAQGGIAPEPPRWDGRGDLVLGHMSNLTVEKGLDTVLETFAALAASNPQTRLVLAGPVMSAEEQSLIDAARAQFGNRIDVRGPVYGSDKRRFFSDIDVFLFPTRYRTEAQPLVIAESIAAGKPVVAYGLACIPSLIGAEGGRVVPPETDFVAVASDVIEEWRSDHDRYVAVCRGVAAWAGQLQEDADARLSAFIAQVLEMEPEAVEPVAH